MYKRKFYIKNLKKILALRCFEWANLKIVSCEHVKFGTVNCACSRTRLTVVYKKVVFVKEDFLLRLNYLDASIRGSCRNIVLNRKPSVSKLSSKERGKPRGIKPKEIKTL
jgi:hypothetical protein